MKISATALHGVLLVEPAFFGDSRGFFFESFHAQRYAEAGISLPFVQDNVSRSRRGVLRGLHFQHPHHQGKLVGVLEGEVFDVAVDVRPDSPNFRRWVGEILSADNKRQMYVPPGFAHGFQVLSAEALFAYKCTDYYHPEAERSIRWDDPSIGIDWPIAHAEVSERDRRAPLLEALDPAVLPRL